MAMPMTKPGSISGETRKVDSASRPRNRPRTNAMVHSVPRTRAARVDNAAICSDVVRDEAKPRVAARRAYHRSDSSGDGSVNTADEPNDTAMVTTSGVSRKTTATAAVTHTAKVAPC